MQVSTRMISRIRSSSAPSLASTASKTASQSMPRSVAFAVVPVAIMSGLITRVERIWLLQPFKKALDKRRRETVLLAQLGECVEQLFRNPRHPGLNLETLHNAGRHQVLSARLTQSCRVILVPLTRTEI